jgi:3-dehydroquinate synthase
MRSKVRVDTPSGAYDVLIGTGLLDEAGALIRAAAGPRRMVVVTDETVAALHGDRLGQGLEAAATIAIPPGESAKSFSGLERLCDALLELKVARGDLVVALGGGVVGDLAGFAAAILKRGLDFVQLPTTLLAQVDSSVGGKTAIDTPRGKNLVGAFHQPRLVLADLDVLATLPARELRCGYAEVVKYGFLGDAGFFDWLEVHGEAVLDRDPAALAEAVRRSVEMKAAVVAEDERETGRRALLNFGHTFGHALEAETGFGGALLHGEAVAAGSALAFRFSARLGLCDPAEAARASTHLAGRGLPVRLGEIFKTPPAADRLNGHMAQDKKAENGGLTFVLARRIGETFVAKGVEPDRLRRFLIEEGAV